MIFAYILMALAAVILLFLLYVAIKPSDFRIERSASIAAPLEVVFANVNDFHKWEAWSPWIELDPNSKTTYEGPNSGPGSVFTWAGNNKVGAGRMTILDSRPGELVRIKLDFLKPFPSTSTAEFTFKSAQNHTTVTWSMFGKSAFIPKVFCVFMDMDKMVGGQFEKGLAKLKSIAESSPRA